MHWLSSRSWQEDPFFCREVSPEEVSSLEGALAHWEEAIEVLPSQRESVRLAWL